MLSLFLKRTRNGNCLGFLTREVGIRDIQRFHAPIDCFNIDVHFSDRCERDQRQTVTVSHVEMQRRGFGLSRLAAQSSGQGDFSRVIPQIPAQSQSQHRSAEPKAFGAAGIA